MNSYNIANNHGMLSRGEVKLLKECAELLPYKAVIINIGAGFGTSAAALLEVNPEFTIFSVDILPRPEERENLMLCDVPYLNCMRLLGNSWEIGKGFPYEVDMVFFDGSHVAEDLRKDISAWFPKVKENGILAFHDYNHKNVPELTGIIDESMSGLVHLGTARYLIAFRLCWFT